jgi:CheY-like chemotaxis protein
LILSTWARGAALTRQLLAFSRKQTLAPQPMDLAELVAGTGRLLKQLIGEHIQLVLDIPSTLKRIEADRTQIEQVLLNLAINGRDAMPNGGALRIRLRDVSVTEQFAATHPPMTAGDYVLLEVADDGHGMSSDTKLRAFEPFFTTKHPTKGTGLGLSTVSGIVKQSGGCIWIDSEPNAGTTFQVYLPPTDAEAPPAPLPVPVRNSDKANLTILLAEDEEDVRELLTDMLENHGYKVIAGGSPAEAIERAAAYKGRIDLLLTDVVMPGATGRELADAIQASRPETKVLFISGYPEHGATRGSVLEPGVPFLQKPFTRNLLLEKLRSLVP